MSKILVLDIETTGFLNQGGCIVEIGIVELCLETGFTKIIFDSTLKEDSISSKHTQDPLGWIFKNSDLNFDDILTSPAAEEIYPQVQKILDQYPLGCTAYNKKFDFGFLQDRGITLTELPCPMHLCTNLCKLPNKYGYNNYKWPTVEEAWHFFFPNKQYTELHRGADDALHEAAIVYELYKVGRFSLD